VTLKELKDAWQSCGELLGPAENHGPATPTSCRGLSDPDRRRFRTLAENRQQVEALLDRGVVKRKALLDAILENARLDTPGYVRLSIPERREAVAELTEDGMSNRDQAAVLGVDQTTVRRDRDAANAAPEPRNPSPDAESETAAAANAAAESEQAPPVEDEQPEPRAEPEPEPPSEEEQRAAHEQRVARLPDDLADDVRAERASLSEAERIHRQNTERVAAWAQKLDEAWGGFPSVRRASALDDALRLGSRV
jgi:hypothetical protein